MRKLTLLAGVAVLTLIGYFIYLAHAAGEFRSVDEMHPGVCRKIAGASGPEDITLHPERDLALVSSFDRRAAAEGNPRPGAIYAWALDGSMTRPVNLTPAAGDDFRPHGISLHVGRDGRATVFVVNHPGEPLFGGPAESGAGLPPHTIEVFDFHPDPDGDPDADANPDSGTGAGRLIHRATHEHPSMISPNDVVAVDHQRFYFTNDHGSEPGWKRKLEDYLRLPWAGVVYFDGREFREVADGLSYANGINLSPDGERVYVAEVTRSRIREYARETETGALDELRRIDVGFGVDNIEVDADTGELWLGGHVKLLTFTRHAANAEVPAPSQAVRLAVDGPAAGSDAEPETVFLDDGELVSGASVATYRNGRLLVGSVFDSHFVECDVANAPG